jgi:DNA replication protein DnaD
MLKFGYMSKMWYNVCVREENPLTPTEVYMITHPNQKVITISKQPMRGHFVQINKDDLIIASQFLSPTGFKLWTFLNFHKQEYKFAFSPEAYRRVLKLSLTTIRKAVEELVSKNYLYLKKAGSNEYIFEPTYSNPKFWEANEEELAKLRAYIGG